MNRSFVAGVDPAAGGTAGALHGQRHWRPAAWFASLALLGVALLALTAQPAAAAGTPAADKKNYRVLHVMSYHSPWRWTDRQFEGFQEALKGLDVTYQVFQMDTKRNSSKEEKERKAAEARALVEDWKPDLVYTSDDDAQEYFVRRFVNRPLPFVFSGVNADPANYGFVGSTNVTGVLEQEHFVESVRLVRRMAPNARRIALLFDDAKMWDPVRARIVQAMSQLPDMQIVANDVVTTFAEYQRRITAYQRDADVVGTIGIFNLKDANGRNVPYQTVQQWTVENSALPDFAFWVDRVHYGTLCAATVSEREQGRAAGRMARAILAEGRSPASFAMAPTVKGLPVINLARARKLGLKVDAALLLSAEVIQGYEWAQQ
ncbi:MAG TPA: ABC transporter substrate binding protein [Rhodocyclaceae bacterium]|nr:hypothetical protein [Rhodocyclaceae bacterium]HMV52608.1 ABC transporter substrate binding protein [Rhodocyclaceae bacterium]HMZ83942.1 ABC transporter substrate binding protein [Rhodocyclaceae bacterium]HNA03726.1 ABC transporter substrate binding protein [Rhodocyclaceae bacterium]HNB79436.1 ABC transporter substrate binding protein [Rhodocyclaceae bacterium]